MFRLSLGFEEVKRLDAPLVRWHSRPLAALFVVLNISIPARAQVVTYEATLFPEQLAWERIATANVARQLENGWLIQTNEEGEREFYRYNIGGISGLVGRFFVEWRVVTDSPEWLIDEWQVPAVLVAGGKAGVSYHFVMTESAAVLLRDVLIPRVIGPVSVGEPHTYRVEVFADNYAWYIDGVVVDSGVPEGPYPDPNARVTWGADVTYDGAPSATTAWDYVRLGRIPEDASGDFDSDGIVTLDDFYFVHECLTNERPGINGGPGQDAGPGCRFADFDFDSDVDLKDIAFLQENFRGNG